MKVVIATEGFKNTGYGHLTRCLSLYQAFIENNITPIFIAKCDSIGEGILEGINLSVQDWINDEENFFKTIEGTDILIIDSYLASENIYNKISEKINVLVCLDDNLRLNYPGGIIINSLIRAEDLPYPGNEKYHYLFGTKYALLRKEFWEIPPKEQKIKIEDVLLTLGGTDHRNLTQSILEELFNLYPQLNYHVVSGRKIDFSDYHEHSNKKIFFYYSINASKMLELMLKCEIAISSGGQTLNELARSGTPAIVLMSAQNQKENINNWEKTGFIKNAGSWSDPLLLENIKKYMDSWLRNSNEVFELSKIGKRYVNGRGSLNIVDEILKYYNRNIQ